MKFGMPTLAELESIEGNLELCGKLGLDFIELNMNLPMFQPDRLENLMADDCIVYTIHLDENFCPTDFNPMIAEAWMETLRRTLHEAKRLGVPVINMHMSKGVYFTLPNGKLYLFERYPAEYIDRMRCFREICEEELIGSRIRICIENTGGYPDFQKPVIDHLLESDVFGLTWDLGHWYKGKTDDAPYMLSRREKIMHFHVHDAGTSGDHLPLGEGEIDLDRMLRIAQECGAHCVLETKTASGLASSVEWLKLNGWM